jgi:cell division protein FtsZ
MTLTQPVVAPQPQVQQAAPQPHYAQQEFAQPVAQAPAAPVQAPVQEGSAFGEAYDDLPQPAYRPQQQARDAHRELHVDEEMTGFVAPRPRAPGTPSPEALARLQAAVNRAPAQGRTAGQPLAARLAAPAPQPVPRPVAEKPRFGINTLINRMTGQAAEPAERAQPVMRQQPLVSPHYDDEQAVDPDHERIEIPAFLRRQAN